MFLSKEIEEIAIAVLQSVAENGKPDDLYKLYDQKDVGNAIGLNVQRGFLTGIKVDKNQNGDYTGNFVGPVRITDAGAQYLIQNPPK